MFGVVGIGAAGNNLADEFARIGYPSIAINFSKSDLDSLEHVKDKLNLVGSEGVGKQRSRAIGLMRNNWESTIEFIKQNFSQPSIEIILVIFSTSGGTGSGLSAFVCELLQEQMYDKVIVACPILPDYSEVIGSQINTQETLDELSKLNICTIPIDNQSVINKHNGRISKSLLYKEINNDFASKISLIHSYTEKSSKSGILDKRDLIQLFSTEGILTISETNISNIIDSKLNHSHFNEEIQKSWKNNIFAPIQYEKIIRAGLIFDGSEDLMKYLRYDKLFDTFTNSPIELFEGYFNEGKGNVITILSGLNWIFDRIEEIDSIIEKQKLKLSNIEDRVYKSKNTNKTSIINAVMNKTETLTQKNRSVSDILNKYAR